jgi:hypothetical protein
MQGRFSEGFQQGNQDNLLHTEAGYHSWSISEDID